MATDWRSLRALDGSREKGFEELCCQLAAGEVYPNGSRFVRVGAPDAGIECFWTLPGGDEHGWQAKFFTSPPNPSQWSQIDKSVKTAIDKRPRLTRYVVCVPTDRPDPRVKRHKSFLDKWNARVTAWKKLAAKRRMSVEVDFWGDHELTSRLNREENRGRHWFWFSDEQFTLDWFRRKLRVAIENAGERYTPVLHVDLPIASRFAALGRTKGFFRELNALYLALRKVGRFEPTRLPKVVQDAATSANAAVRTLCDLFDAILLPEELSGANQPSDPIPWEQMRAVGEPLLEQLDRASAALWKEIHEPPSGAGLESTPQSHRATRDIENAEYLFRKLRRSVSAIVAFCDDVEATLANRPALLLVGEAGQGKTHLLCDIAERDTKEGRPRLLLHGTHFADAEPWSEIVRMLGLKCSTDEFLGALEAAGRAYRCRVLVLIDALNEGEGRSLWAKHLPGMLASVAGNPWVGVAVSVRSSYEQLVIPDSLVPGRLTRVVHGGFEEHEYEAVNRFFTHFGIQPTTPLLVPEFTNPLFLKLFCSGVKEKGWKQVPLGLRGITAILDMFLDAVHEKLWRPERMNYDRATNLVRGATNELVRLMVRSGTNSLPRAQAFKTVNDLHPTTGYNESLFRNLVVEGVLAENRSTSGKESHELVSFVYERFGDHLRAKFLLDTAFNRRAPKKSFGPRTRLGRLLKSEVDGWRNAGLIEALSVQLPERAQRELFEVAPHAVKFRVVREAFIKSIVWRDANAFTAATFKWISRLTGYPPHHNEFLNAVVTLAPIPDHPLNANKLHEVLCRPSMADRDMWWSEFLHDEWSHRRAVSRLVDWTWSESDKATLPESVVLLTGTALAWFLTTSNRFLRDRATKALVKLFENRVTTLRSLLARFWAVNDPYVFERLMAVGYGCAMRSQDTTGLAELAADVFEHVFDGDTILPQLLTRDHARGIIECAPYRDVGQAGAFAASQPPYNSEWPLIEIPDKQTLEHWGAWREAMPDVEWAQREVYSSVVGEGLSDFSRYVIGDLTEWTTVRIGTAPPPTMRQRYEAFVRRLKPAQRKALRKYHQVVEAAQRCQQLSTEQQIELFGRAFSDEVVQREIAAGEQRFTQHVRGNRTLKRLFRSVARPFIANPHRYSQSHRFDGTLARRWMLQRIIDYGWTIERFGEFDRRVNRWESTGRSAHKAERIGKKYEWIAYRELLARLADNFHLREDRYRDSEAGLRTYAGPWNIRYGFERDLDPSVLVRSTPEDDEMTGRAWWSPVGYFEWDAGVSDVAWLRRSGDLPTVESLLVVRDPTDGADWCALDTHPAWRQPTRPGREVYELPQRTIWYMVRSYLVRRGDAARFFRWAKRQDFMGRWMPEPADVHGIHHGEFFWAPAYRETIGGYGPVGWTRGWPERLPVDVLLTAVHYSGESSGFDCSIDDSFRIRLPAQSLVEGMRLHWSGVEGRYVDASGRLVVCDPSVSAPGPGALLVRQDALRHYLAANDLELCWTLLGEKQLIGGGSANTVGWLQLSGVYRLTAGGVVGEMTTQDHSVERPRRRRR